MLTTVIKKLLDVIKKLLDAINKKKEKKKEWFGMLNNYVSMKIKIKR